MIILTALIDIFGVEINKEEVRKNIYILEYEKARISLFEEHLVFVGLAESGGLLSKEQLQCI